MRYLCMLSMWWVAGNADAATYYMDDSSTPGCADAVGQDGSVAEPWCTLSYAQRRLSGGDRLIIRNGDDGVYHETGSVIFDSGNSGNKGAPTVIMADAGAAPEINGPGINSGRVRLGASDHSGIAWVEFGRGITITNFNQGLFVEAGVDITISGLTIHNVGQEGLRIKSNSARVTVENTTVHNAGVNGRNGECFYIGTGSAGPVDNSTDITIKHSTAYNCTHEGVDIKAGSRNVIFENNIIHDAMTAEPYASGMLRVGMCKNGAQNCGAVSPAHIVRNNTVYGFTGDAGISVQTGAHVYNNVIYGISGGAQGILVQNPNSDSHVRFLYHNTIAGGEDAAVRVEAGTVESRNNIGPPTAGSNIAFDSSFFVDAPSNDYHLVEDARPVDNGEELNGVVTTDKDGVPRVINGAADQGAFELGVSPAGTQHMAALSKGFLSFVDSLSRRPPRRYSSSSCLAMNRPPPPHGTWSCE